MLKDCPSVVVQVPCLHLDCIFISRMDAGVLVDVQGERRRERTGGLGWRFNEVKDFYTLGACKLSVIRKEAKRQTLCSLWSGWINPISVYGVLWSSARTPAAWPSLPLAAHAASPLPPLPPAPCDRLQILGPMMLEWHFGLAGIVYKHRALMLSPRPLESWEGLFFMWRFLRMLWEKVKGQSGNE